MNIFFPEYMVLALALLCFGYYMLKARQGGARGGDPPDKGGPPATPFDDEPSSGGADASPKHGSGRT